MPCLRKSVVLVVELGTCCDWALFDQIIEVLSARNEVHLVTSRSTPVKNVTTKYVYTLPEQVVGHTDYAFMSVGLSPLLSACRRR